MLTTIATHAAHPDGVEDDLLLASALRAAGADVRFAVWNDPTVDWSLGDVTVIRSTWDYHLDPTAWFAWLDHVTRRTRLVNPAGLVRWNSDKTYLFDLLSRGVAVIPTVLLTGRVDTRALCAEHGWDDVVIKPTVGANSDGARRFRGDAIGGEGVAHAAALLSSGKALLQPYQSAVEDQRERSLVYIDGEFRYAFTKAAFNGSEGEQSKPRHHATPDERALAAAVLAALPIQPTFARIDLLPSPRGPLMMEAELVEPQLVLEHDAGAVDRFAKALLRAATARPPQ
ncbi:MAG TPA: hypothetical protein VMF52_01215 [Steroidobacteraceae bacterium]|nr:hypothetical protein [Steroidobacteraceae bacterium]